MALSRLLGQEIQVEGMKCMIYMDNSATTAPSEEILSSFLEVNRRFYANAASLHLAGRETDKLLEKSREQILSIVESPDGNVIYTSGGTEANNLAMLGFARKYRNRGNHIITTEIEHPSIINAAKQLEVEGFEVTYLSVNDRGLISLEELSEKLREDTILVSIMHVNNEIGTIQPILECAAIIKKQSRAIFHSDTVQSFGKLPVTLSGDGPDAITISAHKINGLKGSGALIARKGVIPMAINFGGGQELGLRSGTVAVPDAVALAKAMRIAVLKNHSEQYNVWRNQLIIHVKNERDSIILAEEHAAPHILSIAFYGIKGEVAVNFFQKNGIIISTSSACSSKSGNASHVIDAIRLEEKFKHGVIRISFGNNNTEEHILRFKKVFTEFVQLLKRGKTHEVE